MQAARMQRPATVATGCEAVDLLLEGGFPTGIVSEICGVAGSGKTQLCLQLLLQAQRPLAEGGLAASCCYMYSDGLSPLKRLDQLASASDGAVSLNNIFLEAATDPVQLLHALKTRLPPLLDQHNVRLVIVDAITAVFRGLSVDSASEAGDRSRVMFEMVNVMRILAAQYDVAFIVVNQMTANMKTGDGTVPALGLAWSACVNQRFEVAKTRSARTRSIKVLFSPYLPHGVLATFDITAAKLL
ncbi:DNA repair protein XRCC3 [Achlya hypogyna]|uniref:DNA repair protein XRCC3 n=1 Tax=Achlya hypogyna TaxID=1202772 RepID=A0A1V9Z145_ACHHY|nr:DNA repair protein XRCC3 [Achlya hypogyna]